MTYMDNCIIPKGEVTRLGYIRLWNKGNRILAHRKAYQDAYGQIPDGFELDHICRNRGCSNPSHLRVVNHTDNMRNSSKTKLTLDDAKFIHRLHLEGLNLRQISEKFNVTKQCIWRVLKGKNWKDAYPS